MFTDTGSDTTGTVSGQRRDGGPRMPDVYPVEKFMSVYNTSKHSGSVFLSSSSFKMESHF